VTLKENCEAALEGTHGIDRWENWFFNSSGFREDSRERGGNKGIIWVRNINIIETGRKGDRENLWW